MSNRNIMLMRQSLNKTETTNSQTSGELKQSRTQNYYSTRTVGLLLQSDSTQKMHHKTIIASGLISHKSVHETERRFNCEICNLGFYLASQLDLHMRRHTGDKPFMCEICSQMLCDKATLIRHKKRHHLSQLGEFSWAGGAWF
ncbi:hypothetical protein NQ318_016116 [Aromia moschata]|uniref:C2H2-type domain-containing protein n=1 Tax=Aromia moschata TaxID=1265417 RepID=A0AAV8XDH2_9CUCU|nr:hypothetical protein NQ318_016116 [Aromia moschata]